jgi:Zn-dependent M28 family amino/carboxypeptidase
MPLLPLLTLGACGQSNRDSDGRPSNNRKIWEEFSGTKALAHVQALVDFGPRPPASEAIERSRAYIIEQLRRDGWSVTRQTFTNDTPRGKVSFVNLIGRFGNDHEHSAKPPEFLVCSHYDTKIFDNALFVGANDGGSSTGALIELARVLALDPHLASRIELVFFDGEEAYEQFSDIDGLYGSRYYAKQLVEAKRTGAFRGGILWDMIGDRSLTITLPPDSPAHLAHDIFASAAALGARDHFTYFGSAILDDHTPLNKVGVPTIDLIDFDFAAWHTPEDTMDKISAESLHTVGSVTAHFLSQTALR